MAKHPVAGPVLLSASVPDPKRNPHYWETADLIAIREAVIALAEVVLPHQSLVYGGHPAITPLIRLVAESLGKPHQVKLYQSRWFEGELPPDNTAFTQIVYTPAGDSLQESLEIMRTQMLSENRFSAAFFIGGMEGIEEEFELLHNRAPNVPCFAVASTGGAALQLFLTRQDAAPPSLRNELTSNLAYSPLFNRILTDSQFTRAQD